MAGPIHTARSRHHARRKALQALYQWDLTGQPAADIERQFLDGQDMSKADLAYFGELLHGVTGERAHLDGLLAPHVNWPLHQVDPVERALLRLAAFELAERVDTPYRVVINEAVELAKAFGAEQSHKFVNGVLDKLAHTLRRAETGT